MSLRGNSKTHTKDTDSCVLVVHQLLLGLFKHFFGHLSWARVEVVGVWLSRHGGLWFGINEDTQGELKWCASHE